MAVIGLSKPFCAKYSNEGNTVTYSDLAAFGKAVQAEITLNDAEQIILQADNAPSEVASGFSGGTLRLQIDELSIANAAKILGLTPANSSSPTGTGNVIRMTANDVAPNVGIGLVAKKMVNGAIKWLGIVLYKVRFRIPNDNITTQGQTIAFQVPELNATIMRDDTVDNKWKAWGEFDTEANAVAWMNGELTSA